jgi:hypothetical protein
MESEKMKEDVVKDLIEKVKGFPFVQIRLLNSIDLIVNIKKYSIYHHEILQVWFGDDYMTAMIPIREIWKIEMLTG